MNQIFCSPAHKTCRRRTARNRKLVCRSKNCVSPSASFFFFFWVYARSSVIHLVNGWKTTYVYGCVYVCVCTLQCSKVIVKEWWTRIHGWSVLSSHEASNLTMQILQRHWDYFQGVRTWVVDNNHKIKQVILGWLWKGAERIFHLWRRETELGKENFGGNECMLAIWQGGSMNKLTQEDTKDNQRNMSESRQILEKTKQKIRSNLLTQAK